MNTLYGLKYMYNSSCNRLELIRHLVLKATITTEGVWRIRRQERSPVIEIFRMEETGYGDILSDIFLDWRLGLSITSDETVVESKVPEARGL